MTDNWLAELHEMHEQQKAKKANEQTTQSGQVDDLLKQVRALEALRDIRRVLLEGRGTIALFEDESGYDRGMTLLWADPISTIQGPQNVSAPIQYYICIGIVNNQVFVNDQQVSPPTPETLKQALLKAAKNPGYAKKLEPQPEEAQVQFEERDLEEQNFFEEKSQKIDHKSNIRMKLNKLKWSLILLVLFINCLLVWFAIVVLGKLRLAALF